MNKLAIIAKRYSYVATAALLTLAMAAPALISGSADAAQLETRSVQLSSSATGATTVDYEFSYTVPTDGGGSTAGIVIDFCGTNSGATILGSPIVGTDCGEAPGLVRGTTLGTFTQDDGGGATDISTGWTVAAVGGSNTAISITNSTPVVFAGGDEIVLEISGFTNPTTTDTVYPRILTYTLTGGATGYSSGTPGTFLDNGSVAFAPTEEIDVTAIVRETLTFCVAGADEMSAGDCDDAVTAPSVKLGQDMDGTFVIDDSQVWAGNVYYQLTTNAAYGVSLKLAGTSTDLTSGSNTIPGLASAGPIASPDAGFGARVATAGVADEGGPLVATTANFPSTAGQYAMPTGVTGDYGLEFAAVGGPVRSADGVLEFGARSAPNTPAGIYNAQFSIIATPSY